MVICSPLLSTFPLRRGPRSCIPLPEVSAITIKAGEHARFVIASDGVWDVLSVDAARKVVLSVEDPDRAATKLAQTAWDRRIAQNIRMDDISVIIVDLNPDNLVDYQAKADNCCIIS